MLPTVELRRLAAARLEDARTLHAAGRYDWALYTSGYAVECALKAKIADTLNWAGFPSTAKEFDPFKSFKTHDLVTLLKLTGVEQRIRSAHLNEWTEVIQWNPENRYATVGTVTASASQNMVDAAPRLLAVL